MSKPILVTGATGNQGGAVLEALLKRHDLGFVFLALTRDDTSPAAKRISAKSGSVRTLQGDMNNPEKIFSDAHEMVGAPIWGVFMVQVCSFFVLAVHYSHLLFQSVIAGGVTAAQEETQGKGFIDACIKNNVRSFVYSSVDRGGDVRSPQDPTPVSVFASKHRIEQHLFNEADKTNMSWFVLRPTGLIEPTIRNDFFSKIGRTSWKIYMEPERPLHWVSCKDVGHFAAEGLLHPEQWSRKCLSLAGWEGTYMEANAINKKVTGQDFQLTFGLAARFICGIIVKDLSLSYKWCNEKGFGADIGHLRELHPGLLTLEDCLREQAEKAG